MGSLPAGRGHGTKVLVVMAMVCPRCQQTYDRELNCPDCGCRLLYQAVSFENTPAPDPVDESHWQQTPWGKIAVGLLLAGGLSFGLQQLCTAGTLAGNESAFWATLGGLLLLHLLQGSSVVVGSAITGAGQPRGLLYGSIVGLLSGGVFLAFQRHQGDGEPDIVMFAQPLVYLVLGAMGGLFGKWIWQPAPVFSLTTNVPRRLLPTPPSELFAGPVHLGRIFTGAFIVVAGMVWSNVILAQVLQASSGTIPRTSHLQARLIGWELAGLATLLGAALAGATTLNGLKQGFFVGVGAGIVIIGIHMGYEKLVLESLLLMLSSVFVLSLTGGWFGAQLFPPVVARRQRLSTD